MLLLRTEKLPEGPDVQYEIKFDGYRALAMKSGGKVQLRSRNDNDFNVRYPGIVKALAPMPDETVIDGEVVALDNDGKPSFNTLQNYGSAGAPLHFYIFDLLILKGRDVMGEPLVRRRELLEEHVLPNLAEPIRYSPVLEAKLEDLIRSVKAQGLEGLVAKRRNSRHEPGQRSGAWQKMRVNQGQEFVIGGYTKAPRAFDALIPCPLFDQLGRDHSQGGKGFAGSMREDAPQRDQSLTGAALRHGRCASGLGPIASRCT